MKSVPAFTYQSYLKSCGPLCLDGASAEAAQSDLLELGSFLDAGTCVGDEVNGIQVCGDQSDLKSTFMDAASAEAVQGDLLELERFFGIDACVEDDVSLIDHFLLEECHRCGAHAELREAFNQAWMSIFHCKPDPLAFSAWFFEALNAEEAEWPPLPGCELRSKGTTDNLEVPALACITLYLPTKKQLPLGYRGLLKNADTRKAAATKFAETAIELATEIREEWLRRFQLTISGPRTDPLRIVMQRSADGDFQESIELKLLGELPSYMRPARLKLSYKMYVSYAKELLSRFEQHGAEFPGAEPFTARCWQLMLRYQSILGSDGKLAPLHSALTPKVMSSLVQEFGVTHELFASPLNCRLPGYCSLFEDTDKLFGSSGSFFNFIRPDGPLVTLGGSYECNPPFNDQLFQLVVPALLEALTLCELPLCIVLILPCWTWSKALATASTSRFCRGRMQIKGPIHAYMNGLQHCCKSKERVWFSDPKNHGIGWSSVVLVLQNDAWVADFPISEENLARHRASWGKI
jgi:phosphorylated CTD-interacting factor 1